MTLRLHFREDLEFAAVKANQAVANDLLRIASKGVGMLAVAAGKYGLGCRAGWKDASSLEACCNRGGVSGLLKAESANQPEPDDPEGDA